MGISQPVLAMANFVLTTLLNTWDLSNMEEASTILFYLLVLFTLYKLCHLKLFVAILINIHE